MISLKLCRNILIRFLVVLVIISSFLVPPGFCQETEDSQIFISGFNAYQQKDYATAIEKMNEVLQKYPDTPLRDMALFWLSRSYFKGGNQQEAARFMSQFSKEYPDNPLKGTVEEDLLNLVVRYERGEKLSAGPAPAKSAEKQAAAQKAKLEKERLAQEKAEKDRLAQQQAEQQRLAKAKAEQERIASEKAEQARLAALKAEEERKAAAEATLLVAAQKEQQRIIAEKAEQERLAQDKLAAEKAEQQRLAASKSAEERKAVELAEQLRLEQEKAERLRIAALQSEEERKSAEKAEQDRLAKEKSERGRLAVLAAEQQRLAALKAEEARQAAETASKERLATAKAEQERLAALKSDEERKLAEKAELERIAVRKAEEERAAVAAAEAARSAAAKQEQERMAAEKAAEKAEAARLAAAKQEELERVAAARAEELRLARQRDAEEKIRSEKMVLREKAIAQYKSVIEKYPGTKAATVAAAKLQELGVAVALPPQVAAVEQKPVEPENAQVLKLEVAQYAGFEFNLLPRSQSYDVGRRISVPFEVINRGNGSDSFYFESGFPPEFSASFASVATPDQNINQTPVLAPGETFRGVVTLTIPASSIDGLRITHPVKVASRFMSEASQSREVYMVASAPLLRAVLKTDKTQPLPGEKVVYRIAVLNVGSTAAQNVTLRLNFPPQLEPVDYAAAGFKQEMKSVLVLDGLQINSGESKEFTVTFQLKDDSLAGQELLCRAELINNPLKTTAVFMSNPSSVQPQHGIAVRSGAERLVVIPGQTITVPFVVTNTGNVREKFRIASTVKGAQEAIIFQDLNRDGIRQSNEPVISELGPLAPKEEVSIVMEVKTTGNASDGTEGSVQLAFSPEGDAARAAEGSARLIYSRPVLQMAMAGRDGRLRPGEVASFDLTITNHGSNLARVVELQSAWPEQLELVAADPASSSISGGNILWKFNELGAGEKRTIKVSFRVKPGTGVGMNIQVKNVLKYEDQLGNRY